MLLCCSSSLSLCYPCFLFLSLSLFLSFSPFSVALVYTHTHTHVLHLSFSHKHTHILSHSHHAHNAKVLTTFPVVVKKNAFLANQSVHPPAPLNHAKILKGWPCWYASVLEPSWYNTLPPEHIGLVKMNDSTMLSNKTSTAQSCADDQILDHFILRNGFYIDTER